MHPYQLLPFPLLFSPRTGPSLRPSRTSYLSPRPDISGAPAALRRCLRCRPPSLSFPPAPRASLCRQNPTASAGPTTPTPVVAPYVTRLRIWRPSPPPPPAPPPSLTPHAARTPRSSLAATPPSSAPHAALAIAWHHSCAASVLSCRLLYGTLIGSLLDS